jgi:hypothetical protein
VVIAPINLARILKVRGRRWSMEISRDRFGHRDRRTRAVTADGSEGFA